MPSRPDETCWTLIRAAAEGRSREREELTRRYLPVVRAYLSARWSASVMRDEVEDAVQEVFVACFKQGGALERVDAGTGNGFRAFLFGVTRNVALHLERTRARRDARFGPAPPSQFHSDDASLSRVYDRAYARSVMRQAAEAMAASARGSSEAAERRVQLLRLRFEEGLALREVARLWGADPEEIRREYAEGAREFQACLRGVVGLSERCSADRLQAECDRLLEMLR